MTRVQTIHRIEEEVVLEKQTQKWIQLIWQHTNNTVHTEYKNTPYIQISLKICPIEVSYICFFWTSVKHWKTPRCSALGVSHKISKVFGDFVGFKVQHDVRLWFKVRQHLSTALLPCFTRRFSVFTWSITRFPFTSPSLPTVVPCVLSLLTPKALWLFSSKFVLERRVGGPG